MWKDWFWLYAVNCLFTALLSSGYLIFQSNGLSGLAFWALPAAIISQAFFLNLAPGLFSFLAYLLLRNRTAARVVSIGPYFLSQLAVLVDLVIFRFFHRHFDGMIWGALTTKGVGDSVRLGRSNYLVIAGIVLVLLGTVIGLSLRLSRVLSKCRCRYLVACALACLLWERGVYAIADLKDDTAVYWVQETVPLYQPLTIKKLARRLGWHVTPRETFSRPGGERALNFPRRPIGFRLPPRRPNILMLVVDSARADCLQPDLMPHLSKWSRAAIWMRRHHSTGHETGEGIFGLLYGIPGTYFPRAIAETKSPPLLDLLSGLQYDFRILSCADLNYPKFRPTAFAKLTNQVTDHWSGPRVARDQVMTEAFLAFLHERAATPPTEQRPFFCFMLYDAAHQPYYCLPEYLLDPNDEPAPTINYARIAAHPAESKKIRKYYNNGLHYVDAQIGRILRELEAQHLFEQTIVVIVGDHGEEFGECGRFGHVSTFDQYQTRTLALAHFPGVSPRVEDRITSHVDFVPSILSWMGATNAPNEYSTGYPLPAPNQRAFVLCSGWDRYALIKSNSVAVFNRYRAQYFDNDYHPIDPHDPRCPNHEEIMLGVREMSAFFK